ncbi:protein ASPARTIC PROTEASE IN GUARD CELL 1-like [Silene latifolia]|uniref:protein ASPARTIC PROTEASE IN GUARD CELL 1-like n=1 Tax=Silene latifolia TaxID=37657 RepID=UPI003D778EF0
MESKINYLVFPYIFLAIFPCLLKLPLVSSRIMLFPTSKTQILNVTTTPNYLKQISPKMQTSISIQLPNRPLTLKLHTRQSLLPNNHTHKDHKSLLLNQLTRDSRRVSSIQTRLDLTIKSDLGAPIISGTSQGGGEYFTRIGVGQPLRDVYVIIDTGSDISWVQCEPCSHCYTQSNPIFDPKRSSTFKSIPCNSSTCDALDVSDCRLGQCLYEVSYGDGSYTSGNFVTETITFDGGRSINNLAVGCGHNNDGYFAGAGGLLGLGGGPLSLPSQINASFFSYCLVDRDSTAASTLELVNTNTNSETTQTNSNITSVTAPLVRNHMLDTFYYLGLTGFTVGGNVLEIPATSFQIDRQGSGGMIIDSGTAVTRLESRVYELLRDEFRQGTSHLPTADDVAIFDTCFDLRGLDSVEFPAVELLFGGTQSLVLPARNYVIPVDGDGTFCFAFAPTTSSMSILGNVQQQGIRVGFDLVKSLVTFQAEAC